MPFRARKSLVRWETTIPDSPSVMSSFMGPWMVIHPVSMAFINVVSSLFGTTRAACHLVHLSSIWKMMNLCTNKRSHSTCWLNASASCTLQALLGPGLAHCRHTEQVLQISGISSSTRSATPMCFRKRVMVCSEACHHRTCSFRRDSRMAASRFVRKMRTTRPMSNLLQSWAASGLSP